VVLRFTAPAAPETLTAYEVRAQVRHLTVTNLLAAPTVPHTHAPAPSGTAEALVLSGLEPGQTLQFALRGLHAAGATDFSCPVASRVTGGHVAAAGAIALNAPATLTVEGGRYRLSGDVSAPGTAFVIAARGVTLDLGGHTVTYGTAGGAAPGIYAEYLYGSGETKVLNGRIVQAAPGAASSPAVELRGGHDIEFGWLDVVVRGADCSGLVVWDNPTGDLRVHHCRVACDTQVVSNRHFPGVAAIWLAGISRRCEIDHNRVTSSPQWGVRIQADASEAPFDVHHNVVEGTRSRVANAYMIGIYKPDAFVFDNRLEGESRGIHLDGEYGAGRNAQVHDNRIRAQDHANEEYPQHWCHGIKVETSAGSHVHHNHVHAVADAATAAAYALDLGLGSASDVTVENNLFLATSSTPLFEARALEWTYGAEGVNRLACRLNVFRATNRLIHRGWPSAAGGLLQGNAFAREVTPGGSSTFSFEHFETADQGTNQGHRIADPITQEDAALVTQWAQPGPYETRREHTLSLFVKDGAGTPVPSATLRVRDRVGALVFNGTTDAAGRRDVPLLAQRITNGPAVDARGPFEVEVDAGNAGTWEGPVELPRRRALHVTLGASPSGALDQTPPAAPVGLFGLAASASRVHLEWSPPSDPSGIAAYLVYVDGELVAVAAQPEVAVAGLAADRSHAFSVAAVDGGGNLGPRSADLVVRTRPEDREP